MTQESAGLRLPALDARLRCIAGMVPRCELAADIGADHGRLSCHLLASGRCDRMIVSDISSDSLSKSRRLLTAHGLSDRALLRVADGLKAIGEPVSAVVIAGMGGKTIAEIAREHERIGDARLIVSAHTEMPYLRKKLYEYGFLFEKETVVRASGRYYTVLAARKGAAHYEARDLYLGVNTGGDCLIDYWQWRSAVETVRRDADRDLHLGWIREAMENERCKQQTDIQADR